MKELSIELYNIKRHINMLATMCIEMNDELLFNQKLQETIDRVKEKNTESGFKILNEHINEYLKEGGELEQYLNEYVKRQKS